jgi:cell pole-organizing protein PopZ
MKDNEKIKIDEALSHIKKAIIETDDIESKNVNNNDYILLDKIVTNKNEKVIDKKKLGIKKHKKKNIIEKNKKKSSPNKKKEIKSKLIKKNKQKSPVDDLVDKEVKPIIKKWIDKNLRTFVKNIVVEEMKSISKATQKPNNR